jgi:hypothetical protein
LLHFFFGPVLRIFPKERRTMNPTLKVVFLWLATATFVQTANAQFEQLVNKVPSSANAIVFLNVEKIMMSPVALKENWKTEHRKTYQAGLTFLPPNSQVSVLAAQMNFDSMIPHWSMAAMALDHVPALPSIALAAGGRMDQFGKYAAVALKGDAYLIQFAPQIVAAIGPASRQGVARWVREVDAGSEGNLTSYLQEAFRFANEAGTPIVMAVDLQDVIPTDDIRIAVQESDAYSKVDPKLVEEMVKLLSSVRGAVLGITLDTDKPFAKLKVDFVEPVNLTPDQAKALLIHSLARRGAMLDELDEWTPKVGANFITMEGYLTRSGLNRLSSLIDRPPTFMKDVPVKPDETALNQNTQTQGSGSLSHSQEYFYRAEDLIEDLRKKPRESPTYTVGQIAVWYDAYARKLDQLPTKGVDPELLNYGAFAADSLRAAGSTIRASLARKRARQASTPVPIDVYTYGIEYGYVRRWDGSYTGLGEAGAVKVPDYRSYQQAKTAISAQERVTGITDAKEILSKLDEASGDIRRKRSEKYKVDF